MNKEIEASEPVEEANNDGMPLLPLRDVVVFPHMVLPLFVGREKSILALEEASAKDKKILLVTQKDANQDNPGAEDIYRIGTVSTILQLLKLPDGTVKVLVEGVGRAEVIDFIEEDPFFLVEAKEVHDTPLDEKDSEVLTRSLISQFEQYVKLNKKIPPEVIPSLSGIEETIRLVDTIAAHMSLKISEKQDVLEISDLKQRIEHLMNIMESEIEILQVERRIRSHVKKQMEKSQREYYLNEQMKAIQKELGEISEDGSLTEIEQLFEKVEKAGMSKEAKEKCLSELRKLKMMSPMSAEATVSRNYIEWMLSLPWKKRSKASFDIPSAEKILDSDHYGLEKVKERIVEYLAVAKRVRKLKGPVLCLVGPPGVGKTSLGQSIAKAMNRQYVRMSLGGVRDEAEIRGHRKTYIGAMPGKIVQKLAKVGVKNPLFLLDEIDKMAMDFRGDPAAALLEVLDPEQNDSFGDHYLEVDYDLSDITFVATANSLDIPVPLLDRMEVIRLSGYTEDEKLNICTKYLLPKQMKQNGLKKGEMEVTEGAVIDVIRYYTREAGVRGLEREISKLCRKVVKELLSNQDAPEKVQVDSKDLEGILGVRKYRYGQMTEENRVGQVTGLAWTEVGGDILTIEAAAVVGKGKIKTTGKLGDVMQESIQAALTVVRSKANSYGIYSDFHEKIDIHIHVPEGATPKDGPSAGIGMCTALISSLTNIPVRRDVAMTGEITLRGEVLPIGGLKEKLLAAWRAGIKHVIIPEENLRDLKEIPEHTYSGVEIHPVRWFDQVLKIALQEVPKPIDEQVGKVTKDEVYSAESQKEGKDLTSH